MALIAVAADKGAPGVTTTATALATVWPRPVVLAECDPAGGDIVYRLPGAHGGRLDPRRGLLSLAVAARHGLEPGQVWEHAQRLRGGLDVLAGVTNAEQGSGIEPLWGPVGGLLAALPGADVIADCGRLGPDGPHYELLAAAAIVVLIIRPSLGEVLRLRDRVAAVALAAGRRGGREPRIGVLVVAERRGYRRALAEVSHAVGGANSPVGLVAGIAYEPKSAQRLRGEWGGRLDKSLLIRTARDAAAQLAGEGQPGAHQPSAQPARTGPVRAAAPAASWAPDGRPPGAVRLADAVWPSGPRPADTARSAGAAAAAGALPAAHPTGPVRVNGHGLHTAAAAASAGRHTADWPATQGASADGPPAGDWTAAPAAPPAGDWTAARAAPSAGPRGWDRQQHAHHEEAGRPGPPWPDPAWPGSAPGQPAGGQQLNGYPPGAQQRNGYPSAAELTAARVTAAQVAADQLSAAELTAAQAAAARLSAAQAAGARLNPAQAAGARRARRGLSRNTGRSAGRGRHAGGPAQPAADPDATGPSTGRARPRGW